MALISFIFHDFLGVCQNCLLLTLLGINPQNPQGFQICEIREICVNYPFEGQCFLRDARRHQNRQKTRLTAFRLTTASYQLSPR